MRFVATLIAGWMCCLLVSGCLLSPDTRQQTAHDAQAPAKPPSTSPITFPLDMPVAPVAAPAQPRATSTAPARRPGRAASGAYVEPDHAASPRPIEAASTDAALPHDDLAAPNDPAAFSQDASLAPSEQAEAAVSTQHPVSSSPPLDSAPALDGAIEATPSLPQARTGASAMNVPDLALPNIALPPLSLLLYVGAGLLFLLMLLWILRVRRRRARRAELRVWNPGRAHHPPGQTALVDEVLEPPAWLANATIRRRVSPQPTATTPLPAAPTEAPLVANESVAAASERTDTAEEADPRVAEVATSIPPQETPASATAPDVAEATRAPQRASMGGYSTRLPPSRGASLVSPPTPPITVHLGGRSAGAVADDVPLPRAPAMESGHTVAVLGGLTSPEPLSAPVEPASPDAIVSPAIEPERPVAPTSPAPAPAVDAIDEACAQARRLAAQGRQADALAVLRPVLDAAASPTAWAMAGWCAWTLAETSPSPLALAEEAAQAFDRAIALDPTREGALSRMVGRCHLLRADADDTAQRGAHLVAATSAYERGFAQGMASESALLEWAQALYESAVDDTQARPALLARLEAVLARGPEGAETPAAWSRQRARAAWLRASIAPSAAELHRHDQHAALHAQRAFDTTEDAGVRDAWLAECVEAGRRQLIALSPAARSDGYRALAQRLRAWLPQAHGTAPWLAWVHVLADTSQWLQGPAARQRLGEAEAILVRLESRPYDAPGDAHAVTFARAYYQRLRAAHESGDGRRQVLTQAAGLLARLRDNPDFPAQAGVIMEQAEVALALAGEGRDASLHYEEAAKHATTAADIPQTRVAAFAVLLAALLGWQQRAPAPARAQQIALVAQWLAQAEAPPSAATLRLLASAALAQADMAEAARLSAAAWEAGVESQDLLPGWRQADAAWASQLAETSERSAWERQHRLLRLAASSR